MPINYRANKASTLIDLSMAIPESYSFQFQAQELPQKLIKTSQAMLTGYWLIKFFDSSGTIAGNPWYLTISQGQIVFSGDQQLSWQALLKTFQRYVPHLRNEDVKHAILLAEQQFIQQQQTMRSPDELPEDLQWQSLIGEKAVEKALRLKILTDFDAYLFKHAGHAQFVPCPQLNIQTPILRLGFGIEDLLAQARERQAWWNRLRAQISSMECVPTLNTEVLKASNLRAEQKQQLQVMASGNKTLNEIASALAQDSLEIAKIFAKLINEQLVVLAPTKAKTTSEIVVVDDSPLLLKQFEGLVTSWGYNVQLFHDPTHALQAVTHANPAVIFLDINMPDITGFDLVKQIRRQPKLASVPIVMLTAEKTLSNNWRARWSGCRFLSKPLTPDEVPNFQMELRMMLAELVPIERQN